ncbi:MAG: hypothetical protein HZC54_02245 [Verrucomicrobia bacterium]|nr:hypothetical protein [Verrucomicrobiota bacterium]
MDIDREADAKLSLGAPEMWHDRARQAAIEQRQLLLTLSTACLAVFFVTLTGDNAVKLSLLQRIFARSGLLGMGVSIFAGVICVFADARRCYNLARHLQAESKSEDELATAFFARYQLYLRVYIFSYWVQRTAFLVAIAAAVVYTMTLVR